MDPVVDRAKRLTKNYLSKALSNESIANEAVETYQQNGIRDDGPYWKRSNKPTLLGHILPDYAARKASSNLSMNM